MAQNFDRRRINGPEDSILPVFDPEQEDASPYASWKTGDSRRGRAPGDIRPICARTYPLLEISKLIRVWQF